MRLLSKARITADNIIVRVPIQKGDVTELIEVTLQQLINGLMQSQSELYRKVDELEKKLDAHLDELKSDGK